MKRSLGFWLASPILLLGPAPLAAQSIGNPMTQMLGTISINQQVSGNLAPSDFLWNGKPFHSWGFQCMQGQSFQMDVLSTWDNYAVVVDPRGNTAATNDDGGDGLNARINFTCAMSGPHRLVVTTYSTSTNPGQYTLQVQGQAASAFASAPIGPTAPFVGTIGVNQQVAFSFTGAEPRWNNRPYQAWGLTCQPGQTFQVDVLSSWDNIAYVFDPAGTQVAMNDDGGEGLNARVSAACSQGGAYRLVVTSYSTNTPTSPYTLQIQGQAAAVAMAPPPVAASPIEAQSSTVGTAAGGFEPNTVPLNTASGGFCPQPQGTCRDAGTAVEWRSRTGAPGSFGAPLPNTSDRICRGYFRKSGGMEVTDFGALLGVIRDQDSACRVPVLGGIATATNYELLDGPMWLRDATAWVPYGNGEVPDNAAVAAVMLDEEQFACTSGGSAGRISATTGGCVIIVNNTVEVRTSYSVLIQR